MSRRKHKKHEKEPNHERWLVSYADFITLLFATFVMLYAMSQTDQSKLEALVASMQEAFGSLNRGTTMERAAMMEGGDMRPVPAITPTQLTPGLERAKTGPGKATAGEAQMAALKTALEAAIKQASAADRVNVSVTRRGLVVSISEAGFFDSGSAVLKPESYALLGTIAGPLARYDNALRVEGNTDNQPISSAAFRSNWELSTTRATGVIHYLLGNFDFQPESLSAIGYGEFRPVADNGTPEGRARNRHIDLVLLNDAAASAEARPMRQRAVSDEEPTRAGPVAPGLPKAPATPF